jgi:hypothetical protein
VSFLGEGVAATSLSYPADKRGEIEKRKVEPCCRLFGCQRSLAPGMESFRKIFCRAEGFEPICRFITGLILSPNKTLQGVYDLQVWEGEAPSRRAMHEAVFDQGGMGPPLLSITEPKWLTPIKGEAAR